MADVDDGCSSESILDQCQLLLKSLCSDSRDGKALALPFLHCLNKIFDKLRFLRETLDGFYPVTIFYSNTDAVIKLDQHISANRDCFEVVKKYCQESLVSATKVQEFMTEVVDSFLEADDEKTQSFKDTMLAMKKTYKLLQASHAIYDEDISRIESELTDIEEAVKGMHALQRMQRTTMINRENEASGDDEYEPDETC